MRLRWPNAYFQNADQEDYHPIDSSRVLIQGGRSREFFVFIDREAAAAWDRDVRNAGELEFDAPFPR